MKLTDALLGLLVLPTLAALGGCASSGPAAPPRASALTSIETGPPAPLPPTAFRPSTARADGHARLAESVTIGDSSANDAAYDDPHRRVRPAQDAAPHTWNAFESERGSTYHRYFYGSRPRYRSYGRGSRGRGSSSRRSSSGTSKTGLPPVGGSWAPPPNFGPAIGR